MFDSMRGFFEKTTSVLEKTPQQSGASSATSTATNAVTAAGSAAANMSSAAFKNVASLVSIPPAQAENLKLIAAASLFGYVGQTLAKDVYVLLRQTKAGRQAYKVRYFPVFRLPFVVGGFGGLGPHGTRNADPLTYLPLTSGRTTTQPPPAASFLPHRALCSLRGPALSPGS